MHKTAVIVDSACSLPSSLLTKYNITMLPISYSVDEEQFIDPCNEEDILDIFESGVFKRKFEVNTAPPTAQAFEAAIIEKIKQGHNQIIVQTVNRTQGETYNNANAGAALVQQRLDGRDISIRVMDSRTVFAGQGLMATETVRRLLKSNDPIESRRQMDKISARIHTYIMPKDPKVALVRAKNRNENNVSWGQAFIASALGIHPILCNRDDASNMVAKVFGFNKGAEKLFKHTISRIQVGLLSPIVTVNYAGPLEELYNMPGYAELKETAKQHKIMLIPSVMSICGGIYTSVGSLVIAMATPDHNW